MKLFKNATFYTMEEENKKTNMILTDNGVIIATGNDCLNYEPREIIDLKRSFVFPGFTDAHIHLIGYGRKLLANVIKTNNVIDEIKNFYNNEDLFVEGYFDRGLTKDDLDLITREYMIILRHNDYHSFTVNSKVLEQINFKHETGILLEEDAKKVLPIWSNYSKELLEKMTTKAILSLYKYGITGVHTDDLSYFNSYQETLDILDRKSKENPFRVNMLIHYDVFDEYINDYSISNKYLKDIQVKLFYDGTISSKTALLKENYKNSTTNGLRMDNEKIFLEKIKKIRDKNCSIAIHTIGDLALNEVTNILNKHKNNSNMMDRIVHASLADMETIDKLSKCNIALDIQPLFIESDKETISKNINHKLLIYPFKEYNNYHILLNGSSDAPVEDPNPLLGIYYMGISRYESIKTYTVNPGITINDNIGMIKVGYKADFSAFKKDLMTIKLAELKETKVYATIIDEKIVYRNEEK